MMDTPMNTNDTGTRTNCGQPLHTHGSVNRGLEQFLGRLGVTDADVEQYINTAREYLQGNGEKAKEYAKENPGKVAAGVAVLAVGAGLLISAMNRD